MRSRYMLSNTTDIIICQVMEHLVYSNMKYSTNNTMDMTSFSIIN